MTHRNDDGAAFDALSALHAEGWAYVAELIAGDLGVRARLMLSRGTVCALESAPTLGACLARCAKVLRIEDHPAVRAAAQHAETIPAPPEAMG